MDIVVGASAISAVIANEPHRSRLIELTEGMDLVVPSSVHWEIGNAFSAMLKHGRITDEQLLRAVEIYDDVPIPFLDVEPAKSLAIAASLGIYACDAYLIRCGQRFRLPLLALNRALAEAARSLGVEVIEVES